MNQKILIVIIGIVVLAVVGYILVVKNSPEEPVELTKISLVLDWLPQAFHAPLFFAKERGYFAEEGLEVEFRVPADPTTVLQTVAAGKDDFGINYPADVLVARSERVPVVSVMTLIQHPLITFSALKDSGIKEPRDLAGKKVALPVVTTSKGTLETMLKYQGKSLEDVEIVDPGYDVITPLISGNVDASMLLWGMETLLVEEQGFSLNIMRSQEYGVPDYPEIIFITTQEKVLENPELVQKFVRAVARGYEDATVDLQAAVQAMKRAKPEVDADFQNRSIEILAPLWKADNGVFGWQEEARWLNFAQWMKDNDLLSADVDARQAFTNRFVEGTQGD